MGGVPPSRTPIRPQVDRRQPLQPPTVPGPRPPAPGLLKRATVAADTGALSLVAPQGQVEVPLRQPVQVQLRQQLRNCLGAPGKKGQDPAATLLLQPPHPRPPQRHRPHRGQQLPRPPVASPRPSRPVHGRPPLVPYPAQKLRHFGLQGRLEQLLGRLPEPIMQPLPSGPLTSGSLAWSARACRWLSSFPGLPTLRFPGRRVHRPRISTPFLSVPPVKAAV